MTIVFAKTFGEKICFLSDTMITDDNTGKNNPIPGRMKVIPVRNNLTIAYAGVSNPAIDAVRTIYAQMSHSDVGDILDFLRQSTIDNENRIDYLLASHVEKPTLFKIWNGRISEPLEEAFIGDPTSIPKIRTGMSDSGDAESDMQAFYSSFIRLFLDSGTEIHDGVGGVPIILIAESEQHHFKNYSFGMHWKPIKFEDGPIQYENEDDSLTGEWNYRIAFIPTTEFAGALAALAVPQAKLGFIYSPLNEDDPHPIRLLEKERKWTQCEREIYDRLAAILNTQAAFLPRPKT